RSESERSHNTRNSRERRGSAHDFGRGVGIWGMRTLVLGSKLVALAWLAASALPTAVAAQDGWPWQTQEGSYRAPPRSANQAGRASPDAPGVRPPAATTPARGWREPVGGRGAPAYQDGP